MRISRTVLALCFSPLSLASPPSANFYLSSDNALSPHSTLDISQKEARIILASRLGLSHYHSLDTDVDISKIEQSGSRQKTLWATDSQQDGRAVIVVSGIENSNDAKPRFTLPNSPSSSSFRDLIKSLEAQTEEDAGSEAHSIYTNSFGGFVDIVSPVKWQGTFDVDTEYLNNWENFEKKAPKVVVSLFDSSELSHVAFFEEFSLLHELSVSTIDAIMTDKGALFMNMVSLEGILKKHGETSAQYKAATELFSKALASVQKSLDDHSYNIILLPVSSKAPNKDLVGSYTKKLKQRNVMPRQEQTMQLKQASSSSSSSSGQATSGPEDSPVFVGPYHSCYNTEHSCQNATKSCNGRGSCTTLKTQPQCWTCACNATVKEVGKGLNKTTYWGGPACEKEDVSAPFLLFVGFTIFIMVVVVSMIGQMIQMGNEELPGTLSAGVSYKRA